MRNVSLEERVCESFYAENLNAALNKIKRIRNLGELRFDLSKLTIDDLSEIKNKSKKPLIFTYRSKQDTKQKALSAYIKVIDLGFEYIDLDFYEDQEILIKLKKLLKTRKTKLIISHHNFKETADLKILQTILKELASSQAELIKIACFINSSSDLDTLESLQQSSANAIILGMGNQAPKSRVRSLKAGAKFVYLALDNNETTAKGQIDYLDFQKKYNAFRGGEKIKLAVLGNPIAHSKSPMLFKNLFEQNKLVGVYEKIELADISEFEELKLQYDGFNVTAPFKQSIIPYLDHLSDAAKKIGAVNTVFKSKDKWIGDNTDFIGISKAIEGVIALDQIDNCLILGAGGAARAAAYAMNLVNIKTFITNRTLSKAEQLAQEFGCSTCTTPSPSSYQLIINTIPQPFSLINHLELTSHHIVLDGIYPLSVFSELNNQVNFKLIPGEIWLKEQAKSAFNLFTKPII